MTVGGVAAERGAKDASSAVDSLGEDFYKLILENEPFKSTKVSEYFVSNHLFFGLFMLFCQDDQGHLLYRRLKRLTTFFEFAQVEEITRFYRWAPFLPVQHDDSMLTVLLLLTKFRLRSIPVVDINKGVVKNMISQSSVVKGLAQCQGRDWFDTLAAKSVHEVGLPVMLPNQVLQASKYWLSFFFVILEI